MFSLKSLAIVTGPFHQLSYCGKTGGFNPVLSCPAYFLDLRMCEALGSQSSAWLGNTQPVRTPDSTSSDLVNQISFLY